MIKLGSDKSYTGKDIEAWANDNQGSNDIASRIKKKYFAGTNGSPEKCSFYFINVTDSGGIILKRDHRRSPKYHTRQSRAS